MCAVCSFAQSKFFTKTTITCAPCNRFSSNWARLKGHENLHLFIAVCYIFFFVNFIAHAIKVFKRNLRSWRSIFCAIFSSPKSMFNFLTFVLWVQDGALRAVEVIVTSKICYKIDVQYKLRIC